MAEKDTDYVTKSWLENNGLTVNTSTHSYGNNDFVIEDDVSVGSSSGSESNNYIFKVNLRNAQGSITNAQVYLFADFSSTPSKSQLAAAEAMELMEDDIFGISTIKNDNGRYILPVNVFNGSDIQRANLSFTNIKIQIVYVINNGSVQTYQHSLTSLDEIVVINVI